jgi:prepilin-type N-terminal cleavage/methylation domain-containing protein
VGYSLIEMLTVMLIMSVVFAGITTVFVAGSKAQNEQNRRFQAQLNTRLALDKVRRDTHCATDVTPYAVDKVTLKLPTACGGDKTYCTAAVGSTGTRYALYSAAGTISGACAGTKLIDYLTTGNVFTAFAHTSGCGCLASLTVDFPVSVKGGSVGSYELRDTIFLRNSTRI